MKTQYHTDDAAPCWKCSGTIATYTVDDAVSLIDVLCVACHRTDVFRALTAKPLECAADVSAAHREAAGFMTPCIFYRTKELS